jgi:hypothetical protein
MLSDNKNFNFEVGKDVEKIGLFYIFARYIFPTIVYAILSVIAIALVIYFLIYLANNPISFIDDSSCFN